MPKPEIDPVLDYFLSDDYEEDTTARTGGNTTDPSGSDEIISTDNKTDSSLTIIIVTVSGIILLIGLSLIIGYCRHLKRRQEANLTLRTLHYYVY